VNDALSKVRDNDTNQVILPVAVGGIFLFVLLIGALVG
jgi:hypothetical protein